MLVVDCLRKRRRGGRRVMIEGMRRGMRRVLSQVGGGMEVGL